MYYSAKELKQLTQEDYFNHPLVSHLKPLIHRKPIHNSMRKYEDPLVVIHVINRDGKKEGNTQQFIMVITSKDQ